MTKRPAIVALFVLLLTNILNSQSLLTYADGEKPGSTVKTAYESPVFEFKAYSINAELKDISSEAAGNHPFGDITAKKMYLLNERYTYEVPVVPGNPQTKTVIRKPVIYNAVKRIEKDLKKTVKKGELSHQVAEEEFNKVIDVALNILTANTDSFEEAITKAKSIDSEIDLFTRKVILKY